MRLWRSVTHLPVTASPASKHLAVTLGVRLFRAGLKTMASFPFPIDDPSKLTFAEHITQCSDRIDVIASVAYDGRPFKGFQQQPKFTDKTVEAVLNGALNDYFFKGAPDTESSRKIAISAVSRTDAEVSAKCQLIRCTVPSVTLVRLAAGLPDAGSSDKDAALAARVREGVNTLLRDAAWPVHINRVRFAIGSQVRLRQTVVRKEYSYYLLPMPKKDKVAFAELNRLKEQLGQVHKPALEPLDISIMRAALKDLEGTHDFKFLALAKRFSPSHGEWEKNRIASKTAEMGRDKLITMGAAEEDDAEDAEADSEDDGDGEEAEEPSPVIPSSGAGATASSASSFVNPYERFSWFLSDNANSTVRTVHSAIIELVPLRHLNTGPCEESTPEGPFDDLLGPEPSFGPLTKLRDGTTEPVIMRLRFTADGFMRHQLRIIVGLLIRIGEGALPADSFRTLLNIADKEARDRLEVMLKAKRRRMEGTESVDATAGAATEGDSSPAGAKAGSDAEASSSPDAELVRTKAILGIKTLPKAPGMALILERLVTPDELWTEKWFCNNLHRNFLRDWPFLKPHVNSVHYRQYRIDAGASVAAAGGARGDGAEGEKD